MTVPPAPPILAIETSCDDTAAAVWADGRLASSVVAGQRVREAFGGVVPELASRAHEQPLTLVEVGQRFGLTRERVRQIKEKALRKLRQKHRREELVAHLN